MDGRSLRDSFIATKICSQPASSTNAPSQGHQVTTELSFEGAAASALRRYSFEGDGAAIFGMPSGTNFASRPWLHARSCRRSVAMPRESTGGLEHKHTVSLSMCAMYSGKPLRRLQDLGSSFDDDAPPPLAFPNPYHCKSQAPYFPQLLPRVC